VLFIAADTGHHHSGRGWQEEKDNTGRPICQKAQGKIQDGRDNSMHMHVTTRNDPQLAQCASPETPARFFLPARWSSQQASLPVQATL
jgi:hypothetical protein